MRLWFPGDIRDLILKARRTDAPVLITGESGTGKEQVARAIHGSKNKKPFVTVDCGALVGTLMESELFGHVRGAFTGADRDKRGLVAEASGGTIFFDEIGELQMDLQVKLLRLLQERQYRPVGATQYIEANVRPIFATHRNLPAMIEAGKFREDLYYRLAVVIVHLLPLRERRREIPGLIDHFIRQHTQDEVMLSSAVIEAMVGHGWRGNIRELGNVVHRMLALRQGGLITLADLPAEIGQSQLFGSAEEYAKMTAATLAEAEQLHVEAMLKRFSGDRTRTAEALGISRTALWRKLKSWKIA
jgi:two-component system response regulator HydG